VGRHREGSVADARDPEGESGIGGAVESDHQGNAFVLMKGIMGSEGEARGRGWQTGLLAHSSLRPGRMLAIQNNS